MFASKAWAYPSGAHERSFPLGQATGLTDKHQTRDETLAKKKKTL